MRLTVDSRATCLQQVFLGLLTFVAAVKEQDAHCRCLQLPGNMGMAILILFATCLLCRPMLRTSDTPVMRW
jgi:hypothetical protein